MPLRFLLDENLRGGPLWRAILRHNASGIDPLDVARVGDPASLPCGSVDPDILLWAEREGRILVTLDRQTIAGHLAAHLQSGRWSPGVFLVRGAPSVAQVVVFLVVAAYAGDPADFCDRIEYIP
jgi:hypothetical protein